MGWICGGGTKGYFLAEEHLLSSPLACARGYFFGSQAFFCTCHRPVPPPSFPLFFCIAFLGSYGYLLAWVHFNSQIKLAGLSVIAALLDPILPCAPLWVSVCVCACVGGRVPSFSPFFSFPLPFPLLLVLCGASCRFPLSPLCSCGAGDLDARGFLPAPGLLNCQLLPAGSLFGEVWLSGCPWAPCVCFASFCPLLASARWLLWWGLFLGACLCLSGFCWRCLSCLPCVVCALFYLISSLDLLSDPVLLGLSGSYLPSHG